MPPDPASRPSTTLGTPADAHAALDAAMSPGREAAYPVEVDLSLLGDELRARGVTMGVGRGGRPPAYDRPAEPAEAPKSVGGATPAEPMPAFTAALREVTAAHEPLELRVVVNGAPFTVDAYLAMPIGELCARAAAAAGLPHPDTPRWSMPAWQLRSADGRELFDPAMTVHGAGIDPSEPLFLDPAAGGGAEKGHGGWLAAATAATVPSVSERRSRGGSMPGWWGEPPAAGTRRRLIGDVLRVEDVLSESEIREFADAIELALIVVEGKAIDSDRYRGPAKGREAGLEAALAECFRLTGADPDGASDAMLASEAVEEVRRLRREHDEEIGEVEEVLDIAYIPPASAPAERVAELSRRLGVAERALAKATDDEAMARGAEALTDGIESVDLEHEDLPASLPSGLRFSERELWGRAQDPSVFKVLARLARSRSAFKESEAELVRRNREVVDAGNELDRISIPRAIDADVLSLADRAKLVMQRYTEALARQRNATGPRDGELRIVLEDVSPADQPPEYRFIELEDGEGRGVGLKMQPSERQPFLEVVIPAPAESLVLSAQGLLTAAQRLPQEQYRLLERALAWDVENLGAVPDEDELRPETIALTERSGRRIAKALETLTVTVGGALRVLLDTEGMSEPVTVPRSALTLVMAAHDNGAHTVDGEALRDARDVLRTLLDRTATDRRGS